MRILFLITKSNWGGAQRYVYDLATSLPKDLYQVKVAAGMAADGSGILIERLEAAGIEVIPISSLSNEISIRKEIATARELWQIIRKEKPDILHVNSSKAGIIGALVGRILSVPKVVFTAHGWAFNEDRPIHQKIVLKCIQWMTIAISHTTIAVSDNIRNAFVGWPCIKGKIVVIRNGIKIGAGYGKSGARLAMSGMFPQLKVALAEKNVYWIGTIAELHPVKDIGSAIKAVSKLIEEKRGRGGASHVLPYFIYTVIGEGRERAHLEEMIISLGLSERIFLLGQIPDAFQYIKAFDVFLLPSKSEALGYVLIEAGTQETPVVATAVGGIPEVIEDMRSGVLIQPDKPGEIANAIEFYVKHPDVARSYARALHQAVKADFSLEKMIKGTEGVYEEK